MHDRQILGTTGEDIACEFLEYNSYKILKRNWRYGHFEIDIIAMSQDLLVAIEVKTRRTFKEDPRDSISVKQLKRIERALIHFIDIQQLNIGYRIDLITIERNKVRRTIKHFKEIY